MTTPPLCPETIRACIAALPKRMAHLGAASSDEAIVLREQAAARAALEALLPKDPAKELVEAWLPVQMEQIPPHIMRYLHDFAQFAIQSGKLEVKG